MALERRPNAILYPHGMIVGAGNSDRLVGAKLKFGPVFGSKTVDVGSGPPGANYATPQNWDGAPYITAYYPYGHPLEKQERHNWFLAHEVAPGQWELGDPLDSINDQVDKVRFGYLKTDPHAGDPAVAAKVDEAIAQRAADRRQEKIRRLNDDPEFRERYRKSLELTVEDMDELYPPLNPQA